LCVRSIF
jgi:hypothetical protein